MERYRIVDLVRQVGGWPIKMDAVVLILERADVVFANRGGRDYDEPLTDEELGQMGFTRCH